MATMPKTYTGAITVNIEADHQAGTGPDHRASFERHADRAQAAGREAHQLARSVGEVFGRSLFHVLDEGIEAVTENAGEARWHADRALEDLTAERDALARRVDEQRRLLAVAAAETRARFTRARKPAPAWVEIAEEPF